MAFPGLHLVDGREMIWQDNLAFHLPGLRHLEPSSHAPSRVHPDQRIRTIPRCWKTGDLDYPADGARSWHSISTRKDSAAVTESGPVRVIAMCLHRVGSMKGQDINLLSGIRDIELPRGSLDLKKPTKRGKVIMPISEADVESVYLMQMHSLEFDTIRRMENIRAVTSLLTLTMGRSTKSLEEIDQPMARMPPAGASPEILARIWNRVGRTTSGPIKG